MFRLLSHESTKKTWLLFHERYVLSLPFHESIFPGLSEIEPVAGDSPVAPCGCVSSVHVLALTAVLIQVLLFDDLQYTVPVFSSSKTGKQFT